MNGTGFLSGGYAVPVSAEKTGEQQSDLTHLILHESAGRLRLLLTHSLFFTEVAEDHCQAPREFSEKWASCRFFLLDSAKCQPLSGTAHFSNKMPW